MKIIMINDFIHPAVFYLLGGLLIPLLRGRVKQCYMLLLVVAAFLAVVNMPQGTYGVYEFLNWKLTFGNVDKLSKVFAYIFTIMGVIGVIYSLHVQNDGEHLAAFYYVGGSVGVTFAGDFYLYSYSGRSWLFLQYFWFGIEKYLLLLLRDSGTCYGTLPVD